MMNGRTRARHWLCSTYGASLSISALNSERANVERLAKMTMEELKALDNAFVSVSLNDTSLGKANVYVEKDFGQVFLGYGDVFLGFRPENATWDGTLKIKTIF